MSEFLYNQHSKRNFGLKRYHSMWFILCVFKKRSESELWESEVHDSDSDLHVDPSFPRVLWPLPNSDEVNKQVWYNKTRDPIQLLPNQV